MRMGALRSILLKPATLKQKIEGKTFRVSYCKPLMHNRKDGQHSQWRGQENGEYFDDKAYGFQRRSVPRGR
jgi:hypothetical protein